MAKVELKSFGFKFLQKDNQQPPSGRIEDVRNTLRNPHVDPTLLQLDGTKKKLQEVVLATMGAAELIAELVAYVESRPPYELCRVSIGCAAGRHRSVALIAALAEMLKKRGHIVSVKHMHLQRALNNEKLPK